MHRLASLGLALCAVSPSFGAAQEPGPRPSHEQRLMDAEKEIQSLWDSFFNVVKSELPNTKGSVDCSTGRYEEIKPTNSFLVFFVACERIDRDETGYRASIAIGNPHTFGFGRISGTVSYGENIAAALVRADQRATFEMAGELRPGRWARVQVPIAATRQADVAKIIIEFETGGAIERGSDAPIRSTTAPQYGLRRD